MSTPRPVFTPNGGTNWLDWVLDPRTNAVLFDEVDHARAELAELRKLAKRLTAGIRAVGELISESSGVSGLHRNGDEARWDELLSGGRFEGWLHDFSDAQVAIAEREAAKLRAEEKP